MALPKGAGGVSCLDCNATAAADGKGGGIILRHAEGCPSGLDTSVRSLSVEVPFRPTPTHDIVIVRTWKTTTRTPYNPEYYPGTVGPEEAVEYERSLDIGEKMEMLVADLSFLIEGKTLVLTEEISVEPHQPR